MEAFLIKFLIFWGAETLPARSEMDVVRSWQCQHRPGITFMLIQGSCLQTRRVVVEVRVDRSAPFLTPVSGSFPLRFPLHAEV